jgi:hypothetical protein
MCIVAPQPISAVYFINPFYQSVCIYVYPLIVVRQRLDKNYRGNEYAINNKRFVGRIVCYAVRVVSRKGGD